MFKRIKKIDSSDNEKSNKVTFHQIVWYMLIFSFLGLVVETIYGYLTMGVWQSRKGLILGPYCPIYGVGAVIIILFLNKFRNQKIKLFIYGGILGSVIEYLLSFGMEAMYGTRFWNYTDAYNLNGRICLLYTVFWGILSLILICVVKKWIDKLINKVNYKNKVVKIIDIIIAVLFTVDILLTIWGTTVYKNRAKDEYNKVKIFEEKNIFEKVGDVLFPNKMMENIFPNLRFLDNQGNEIMIRDVLKEK